MKTDLNSILFLQKLQQKYRTLISEVISLPVLTNSMRCDTNCHVTINVIIRDTLFETTDATMSTVITFAYKCRMDRFQCI